MSNKKRSRKKGRVSNLKSKKLKPRKKINSKRKKGPKNSSANEKSQSWNCNKITRKDNTITVQKAKIPCRRYEPFHDHFLSYDQIVTFLEKTRKDHQAAVELVVIGYSGQGKPIYMVVITTESIDGITPKHITLIDAGLKGDDTFAVANALYMIDYLSKNPNYIKIMDYLIVPCGNPDAYDTFIKSKVKAENAPEKRSSSCNMSANKPRTEIPKKQNKEPKNTDCYLFHNWQENLICNSTCSSSSSISSDDLPFIYVNTKKNGKDRYFYHASSENPRKNVSKKTTKTNRKENNTIPMNNPCRGLKEIKTENFRMDLSLNFPVVLGINDLRNLPTDTFLEKLKVWKENYVNTATETFALIRVINTYQFAVKLLISLQEGGEAICYPYGFCAGICDDMQDLREIARKGKNAITQRNFNFGTTYDIKGLTFGSLIDFLKVDKSSIKYAYIIQVHKKKGNYNEKQELKKLMTYGCEIMQCVKRMSSAVYKLYTNMTGNKKVETQSTKPGLKRGATF